MPENLALDVRRGPVTFYVYFVIRDRGHRVILAYRADVTRL